MSTTSENVAMAVADAESADASAQDRTQRMMVRDGFRTALEHAVFGVPVTGFRAVTPKQDLLWKFSWEQGHSEGFHSVADIYLELAPLLFTDDALQAFGWPENEI